MTDSVFPRGVVIRDVEAKWAKISGPAPTNAFGGVQWEMTIVTTDPAKAQEMRDAGLNVKEKEGEFAVGLKRKGFKASGEENEAPKVVDRSLQPFEGRIGNGSTVNVNFWQYEYEFAGRKGIATSLTAVQVVELVEFQGGGATAGFEVLDAAPATAESPF